MIGTTWQVINNLLQGETPPIPVKAIQPPEGATGWSDTWMINSKTAHPNCAYKWLDYIVSPSVNDQVAEWFGEAPANSKACAVSDAAKANCDTFYAADTRLLEVRLVLADARDQVCRRPDRRHLQGLR